MSSSRLQPSWTMRQRLGTTRAEQRAGTAANPHHVMEAVHVTGPLDLDRLAAAWALLLERHWVLRTCFDLADLTWHTAARAASSLELTWLPAQTRTLKNGIELLRAELRRPFDLTRGPLARLHVVPLDEMSFLVGFGVEHLVCDGWSQALLRSELWKLYENPRRLPDVPMTFADVVRAENAWLASDEGVAAMARRTKRLTGIGPLPEVQLPGADPAPDVIDHQDSGKLTWTLDPGLATTLKLVGARRGMSLMGVTHAAFAGSIRRLSGVPRTGTVLAVANRADRAVHHTVGWLSGNVLVLTDGAADVTTLAHLDEFAAAMAEAVDAAALPLVAVMAEMEPDTVGAVAGHPWAGFNPTPASVGRRFPGPAVPGLHMTPVPVPGGWHYKGMLATVAGTPTSISLELAYKRSWFPATTAELLRDDMQDLLHAWARYEQ